MDELKQYIRKTAKDKIILGAFSAVFAIAAGALFAKHSWVLFGAMLLAAVLLFLGAVTSSATDRKFFDSIENSPQRGVILADFAVAKPCANDEIRLGERYIFTRKQTRLIAYGDIQSLRYFEHHDMDTQKVEAGIAIALASGGSRTLCSLYGEAPRMQAEDVYRSVLSKNPNVEIIR